MENKESCDMRLVDQGKDVSGDLDPGDFYFRTDERGQRMFHTCLPNGVGLAIPLRPLVDPKINGGHSWEWDGNELQPTLTPSINSIGVWHGWVRAGRMVSV
jgi:hypothetical protein